MNIKKSALSDWEEGGRPLIVAFAFLSHVSDCASFILDLIRFVDEKKKTKNIPHTVLGKLGGINLV